MSHTIGILELFFIASALMAFSIAFSKTRRAGLISFAIAAVIYCGLIVAFFKIALA